MVVFPILSTLISLACAVVVVADARRRPRPDKIAWAIAFAIFTVAAGTVVAGDLAHWTPFLARLYYLTGAVLVVGYLALGELYLLAPRRIASVAPGATLLVTAVSAALVFAAPVNRAELAAKGWRALDYGTAASILAAVINSLGTAVLVGGVLYSAWRFRRLGIMRHRMIGCLLIAIGTLVVGAGGTATRFGHEEYFYVMMSTGVAIIFAGYLQTRRPDQHRTPASAVAGAAPAPALVPAVAGAALGTQLPGSFDGTGKAASGSGKVAPGRANGHHAGNGAAPTTDGVAADPGLAYLEAHLLPLDDAALSETCRIWSAPRRAGADCFTRAEAHRVWALRLRLSPAGQAAFDAHTVPARLQLTELYHDVLAPEAASAPAPMPEPEAIRPR